jgi:tRNA G10  N-methylase Trm11
LKRKRIKHQIEAGPIRRNRQVVARRIQVTLAATKDEYKSGETQCLDMVHADTTRAGEFFRSGTFDAVVADAPYGVQHGSHTAARGLARSPLDLLATATPVWAGLLRAGGALGVSWNTYVAKRDDAVKVLLDAGLEPLDDEPHLALRHRVDQAIIRDVIVARKP